MENAARSESSPRARVAILAGLLSWLTPGLGQLYNRRPRKCALIVALLLANALLLFLTIRTPMGLLFGFVALAAVYVAAIVDALRDAAHLRDREGGAETRWWRIALFFALVLAGALTLGGALRTVARAYVVPTDSMKPTLRTNDRFMADLRWYESHDPQRGDLAVCRHPQQTGVMFVKRIVAVAGDTVEVRDFRVWIDGELHDELAPDPEWQAYPQLKNVAPEIVPAEHVYLLGDDRARSLDSRIFGPVPVHLLLARPLYIYASPDLARLGRHLE